jgi:4-diphosphocytidyl-2-C-methyl-D-erythritol kinase
MGARLSVRKSIPLGAGLGGGSSDAATTLLVLNHLWKCNLTLEALAQIGATLGADIPLFVMGNSAMASGIGEKLEPLSLGSRYYLLVFSDFPVSTAEIFDHPDLPRDSATISMSQALAGAGNNDCEAVVRLAHPEFDQMLQELGKWGYPHMTGTGSCVFFAMPDKKATNTAASKLKCRYNVRAVRGVDQSPVHKLLQWPSTAAR